MLKKSKNKAPQSPKQQAISFIQEAHDFEKAKVSESEKSKRIAWRITGVSVIVILFLSFALASLVPLKSVQPYVITVDNNTGATEVVNVMRESETSYGQVTDRFWLSQYVKYRENYDWWTVQDSYEASMLLSSAPVQIEISDFFDSPAAPYKVFKDQFRVDVKIISISWIGTTAQIRFEKKVKSLQQGTKDQAVKRYIATIAYRYINTPQTEAERLVNPLGFQVVSYSVDSES